MFDKLFLIVLLSFLATFKCSCFRVESEESQEAASQDNRFIRDQQAVQTQNQNAQQIHSQQSSVEDLDLTQYMSKSNQWHSPMRSQRADQQYSEEDSNSSESQSQYKWNKDSSEEQNQKKQVYGSMESRQRQNQNNPRVNYAALPMFMRTQSFGQAFQKQQLTWQQRSHSSHESSSEEQSGENQQQKLKYTKAHYSFQGMQKQPQDSNESLQMKHSPKMFVEHSSDELHGRHIQNQQGVRGGSSSQEDSNESHSRHQRNNVHHRTRKVPPVRSF